MAEAICDRCENKYDSNLSVNCPKCKSKLKRAEWEKKKVWITKNLYVVATRAFESDSEYLPAIANFYFSSEEGELRRNKIAVKTPEQLEKIFEALDVILESIGWKSREEYLDEIESKKKANSQLDDKMAELIKKFPSTLITILSNFDPALITDDANLSLAREVIDNLNQTIFKTEEKVKVAFKELIKRISKQDSKAMDELSKLLETSSLLEVTSVSRILMSRLMTIEIFEEMVTNEETFEIRGNNSIQSKLENNMWILDEEWWLVQANKTLKKFIGDEIEKEDKNLRPDFVCVSFENRLIIVDIKRPSHDITKEDIDQVENYKIIAKQYKGSDYRGIDCYLVGKKITPKSRSIANERKGIQLMTYAELTEGVKKKYTEYLLALKNARKETEEKSVTEDLPDTKSTP
ncbi:MAG: hypothetical protein Q7S65_00920 [Nanoarchaeota archaeon]|nr:hypothetical protein [Nanoarchaeota archaeon]